MSSDSDTDDISDMVLAGDTEFMDSQGLGYDTTIDLQRRTIAEPAAPATTRATSSSTRPLSLVSTT